MLGWVWFLSLLNNDLFIENVMARPATLSIYSGGESQAFVHVICTAEIVYVHNHAICIQEYTMLKRAKSFLKYPKAILTPKLMQYNNFQYLICCHKEIITYNGKTFNAIIQLWSRQASSHQNRDMKKVIIVKLNTSY